MKSGKTRCSTVRVIWFALVLCGLLHGCSGARQDGGEQAKQGNNNAVPSPKEPESGPMHVASAETTSDVPLAGSPGAPPKEIGTPPTPAPFRARQAPTTISLPGLVEDAVTGGGGRFLVLNLRSLQKLAVVDLNEGKIAGYVSLEDPEELFAAGAEKLIVVDPQTRNARRYALAGLKLEAARPVPGEIPIMAIGMGAASRGPIYAACSDSTRHQIFRIDPATFELFEYQTTVLAGPYLNLRSDMRLSVSADGSALGGWSERSQPGGALVALACAGRMECSYQHISAGYICPDDIGERIYSGIGLLDPLGKRIDDDDPAGQQGVLAVPAVAGPYYLTVSCDDRFAMPVNSAGRQRAPVAFSSAQPAAKGVVSVYVVGETAPMATLPLDEFRLSGNVRRPSDGAPALCRRLFFVPAARVIAEVQDRQKVLVLHPFDIDAELDCSRLDSPLVVSRPPKTVRVGEPFRYQIEAKCKSGKPVYKLDSGPEGMVLSERGLLQWTPASRPASGMASAVISVSDSGRTTAHAVVVAVQPPPEIVVPADNRSPAAGGNPARMVAASGGKAAGDIRVQLPAAYEDVCAGGGGRFLVFHLDSLQKLAVMDVFAARIAGYVPVTGKCLFAAGATKLLVIYPEKLIMQRFDLESQKLEATRPLPGEGSVGAVAMGSASHGPVLLGAGRFKGDPCCWTSTP